MKKIIYASVMIYSILEERHISWAKFNLPFIQMDIKSTPAELVQIYINISKRGNWPINCHIQWFKMQYTTVCFLTFKISCLEEAFTDVTSNGLIWISQQIHWWAENCFRNQHKAEAPRAPPVTAAHLLSLGTSVVDRAVSATSPCTDADPCSCSRCHKRQTTIPWSVFLLQVH